MRTASRPGVTLWQSTFLKHCLESVVRSVRCCKVAVEVLVATDTAFALTGLPNLCDLVAVAPGGGALCKPRLLNAGIEAASGDVLTFLDADMIAGPRWADTVGAFHKLPAARGSVTVPTRLCYRVRQATDEAIHALEGEPARAGRERLINGWFHSYDRLPHHRLHEAYESPEWSTRPGEEGPPFGPKVFGNSQWSILRDVLGDRRFDEAYVGRGFEDIHLVRTIAEDPSYTGLMITEPCRALLHLDHASPMSATDPWNNQNLHKANQMRFEYFDRFVNHWKGVTVLDVGCGGGYASEFLARRGAVVSGADIMPEAIQEAKDHAESVDPAEDQIVFQKPHDPVLALGHVKEAHHGGHRQKQHIRGLGPAPEKRYQKRTDDKDSLWRWDNIH